MAGEQVKKAHQPEIAERSKFTGTKRKAATQSSPLEAKRQKLFETRQKLPVYARRKDIRRALRDHNVLVLSGETGSGKSTQVPQFLLEVPWCTGKIAITQPRRVAATSLARRVAEEMGTPLGKASPASTVGYSVRFDDNTSPSTRIKYLTEGMLLQELLRDATLSQYSCVVVDEVHERSVNVDMILGFLKTLIYGARKGSLRVVVMSATADVEGISRFFSTPPSPSEPENASAESEKDAGEVRSQEPGEVADEKPSQMSGEARTQHPGAHSNGTGGDARSHDLVAICHVEGRQYPVKTHYLDQPTTDVIDAALQRIFTIHIKEPLPGDILVFLTGQEAIQGLQKSVEELAERLPNDVPKVQVLPLYAALPQEAQQRIFTPSPRFTRRIILSTNIAETSVTVPGVRFVIDTGMAKIKQFRHRLGLESLLAKAISKSSADQRKGRAGREAAGQCFRLYTEATYNDLVPATSPEILRCDLATAILAIKARESSTSGTEDIRTFPFPTPPVDEAMNRALLQLFRLEAIDANGAITPLGRQIARLPLTPVLGRVLIDAARPERDCVLDVIDIVACLSVESIFLPAETEYAREKAAEARSQLLRRQGDHLTLLAALQGFAAEHADRKRWARDRLLSHRALRAALDVRKQLRAQCTQQRLLSSSTADHDDPEAPQHQLIDEVRQENILRSFLRGFKDQLARLCPDGAYRTFTGNHVVTIHPASVLFGRKTEAVMYSECVYTTKPYVRGVSAFQLRWLDEILDGSEQGPEA